MTETRTSNPGQVADGRHHPNFWLYAVENIREAERPADRLGQASRVLVAGLAGDPRLNAAWIGAVRPGRLADAIWERSHNSGFPVAIDRIRRNLSDVLCSGTLGQRKAIMETHVAEIRVVDDRLIPAYRIPVDTFCARGQVVGRTGLEPVTDRL